jgi:hypothetical protein
VTGKSADGKWWRVGCPGDSVDGCWVSASVDLTEPASAPHENQLPPPGETQPTDVKFILALQDVPIYGGQEVQYGVIGNVAAGQIAGVTGMSADGKWWRVGCPGDSVDGCWVTADPGYTEPTEPPG